jgi:AraC-like DNA-binding protein
VASPTKQMDRPNRASVALTEPGEVVRHLEAAYGARLRLVRTPVTRRDGRPLLIHTRTDAGQFAIDEIDIPGEVTASPDPLNKVIATWVTSGRLTATCDRIEAKAVADEITLTTQPDAPHDVHAEDLAVTTLLLDPALVASVATGLPRVQAAMPFRFMRFQPHDASAGQLWKDSIAYVRDSVLADGAIATPLVLGNAARLLAAVTLSTFANTATVDAVPHDRNDHQPALIRRAVEYIESNASADIAIADIADAIHVTPRAVQYMFRRHLGTTPTQYMRRVRLHHAHQDLMTADRVHNTVAAIAAKWGFAHTGRFAVQYRQTYGRSPHTTLRDE